MWALRKTPFIAPEKALPRWCCREHVDTICAFHCKSKNNEYVTKSSSTEKKTLAIKSLDIRAFIHSEIFIALYSDLPLWEIWSHFYIFCLLFFFFVLHVWYQNTKFNMHIVGCELLRTTAIYKRNDKSRRVFDGFCFYLLRSRKHFVACVLVRLAFSSLRNHRFRRGINENR